MAGWNAARPRGRQVNFSAPNLVVLGQYGHALGGPCLPDEVLPDPPNPMLSNRWRHEPGNAEKLGSIGRRVSGGPHIFPNLWFMSVTGQVSLRIPRGPHRTDIWWFSFVFEEQDAAERRTMVRRAAGHNGPAGMFELDDGENWEQSTRGMTGAAIQRHPLNYAMNVGTGKVRSDEGGPAHIEAGYNEHAQLWYYSNWAGWLSSESWQELQTRLREPSGNL
jgi:hypothetical protein